MIKFFKHHAIGVFIAIFLFWSKICCSDDEADLEDKDDMEMGPDLSKAFSNAAQDVYEPNEEDFTKAVTQWRRGQ